MLQLNVIKRIVFVFFAGFSLLAASGAAQAELPDFTKLVQKYGPAVVNISTRHEVHNKQAGLPKGMEIPQLPKGTPWDDFFRRFFGDNGKGPEDYETRSLGSGFIIDSDGYILTNNHVVEGADEITVRLSDRRELKAKLVGADKRADIALLKVKASGLPTVKIGDVKQIKVGEWVAAIGSPFGFDHSVSVGVVSALGRSLPHESYVPFIQTDVAINPGNSGGPLFNLDGQVIGINSQIYSETGGYMGLSFAIPIDVAMDAVKQIKEKGYVSRGWLGVLIQDVTRELADSFGMSKPEGALVSKVLKDSPAQKAGLKVGDVILEFNGSPINVSSDLPPLVGRVKAGADARVKVLRDGKMRTLTVRIGELPKEAQIAEETDQPQSAAVNRLGLAVTDLSDDDRKQMGIDKGGVQVKDMQDGAAADAGIRTGDVILKLDNVDITGSGQFERLVKKLPAGKTVPVLILRREGPLFLALKVPAK